MTVSADSEAPQAASPGRACIKALRTPLQDADTVSKKVTRFLLTALVLLSALYASAQPSNQGQILKCLSVENGTDASPTLVKNGLPPPEEPSLLVEFFCEPFGGGISCTKSFPPR